jgi:hypothetical protein
MIFTNYPSTYVPAHSDFLTEVELSTSYANHYILFQLLKGQGDSFENKAETIVPVINGKAVFNIKDFLTPLETDHKPDSLFTSVFLNRYKISASEYYEFNSEPAQQITGDIFNTVPFNLIEQNTNPDIARFLHEQKAYSFFGSDDTFCIYLLTGREEESKTIDVIYKYEDGSTTNHIIDNVSAKSIVTLRFDLFSTYVPDNTFIEIELKLYTASNPDPLDTFILTKKDIKTTELLIKNQFGAWERLLSSGIHEAKLISESETILVSEEEHPHRLFSNDEVIFNTGFLHYENFLKIRNLLKAASFIYSKDNDSYTKFIIDDFSHPEHSDNNSLYYFEIKAHKAKQHYVLY